MGLWIRALGDVGAYELVDSASHGFWSPDGREVGFFSEGKVKRIRLENRIVQAVCDNPEPRGNLEGGTWGPDHTMILHAEDGSLVMVSEKGGIPSPLSVPNRAEKQSAHRHPVFLPDRRHYLFQVLPQREILGASLDGALKKRVLDSSDSKAVYVPPAPEDDGVGWLLFVRQANLLARRFDLARLETQGDEQPLLADVRSNEATGRAAFTVSSNGVLVYRQGDRARIGP